MEGQAHRSAGYEEFRREDGCSSESASGNRRRTYNIRDLSVGRPTIGEGALSYFGIQRCSYQSVHDNWGQT